MADDGVGEAWERLEPEESPGFSGQPYYAAWPAGPSGPTERERQGPPAAVPKPKGGSVRTGPLPLHPMNLSDILDGAFKLYKANARVLIAITAAFVVPVQLLSAYLQRGLFGGQRFLTILNDPATAEGTRRVETSGSWWPSPPACSCCRSSPAR